MADAKKPQTEETEVDVREYFSILWKGKWIIIPLTILGLIIGLVLIYILPPVYSAEVKVLIVESTPSSQIFGDFVTEYSSSKEINFMTQLEILNSRQLREEVIKELSLKIKPDVLKGKIAVSRIDATNIISIKTEDEDPELASKISNSLAGSYIAWNEQTYRQGVSNLLNEISIKLQDSKKDLESTSAKIKSLEDTGREVPESLKKELELTSNMYALLLTNYENLRISQTLESYGANIIEAAIIPESPIKPNKRLFLIASLLIGLVLGAGIVILKEYLDNTIKNSDDAEKYYGLKVISQVVYNKALNVKQRELVSIKDPNSLTHESIKELRTNIGYFNVDKKIKIIGITSAMLDEGKSFISANLAAALAQSGLKILLFNADFRKPTLHKYFNHSNRSGITTVLTGYAKLSDEIKGTAVENLDFLPSGPIPPKPSELLESEAMGILLENLSKRYDYIIVDTSPIVPVTDFIVLAKKLDAIIVVSRVRFVTRAMAKEAALKLAVSGKKVLGIVLNGVIRKGSYYEI